MEGIKTTVFTLIIGVGKMSFLKNAAKSTGKFLLGGLGCLFGLCIWIVGGMYYVSNPTLGAIVVLIGLAVTIFSAFILKGVLK